MKSVNIAGEVHVRKASKDLRMWLPAGVACFCVAVAVMGVAFGYPVLVVALLPGGYAVYSMRDDLKSTEARTVAISFSRSGNGLNIVLEGVRLHGDSYADQHYSCSLNNAKDITIDSGGTCRMRLVQATSKAMVGDYALETVKGTDANIAFKLTEEDWKTLKAFFDDCKIFYSDSFLQAEDAETAPTVDGPAIAQSDAGDEDAGDKGAGNEGAADDADADEADARNAIEA